jgi:hypothetical protein
MGAWRGLRVVLMLSCVLIRAAAPCQNPILNLQPLFRQAAPILFHAGQFLDQQPPLCEQRKKKLNSNPKIVTCGSVFACATPSNPQIHTCGLNFELATPSLKVTTTPKMLHARFF